MKSSIILIVLIVLYQLSAAQDFDEQKLDRYFQALQENDKWMGSVALMKEGNIIYTYSIGYASIEKELKADEHSKYRIGSISKSFTATLIMKAVEDNKLKLSSKLKDFLPGIKNADKITIGDLLYHRSGIYNLTEMEEYEDWSKSPRSRDEIIKLISEFESEFEPGTKAAYSNSNYVLLSYILEKVYKDGFSDILDKLIVKPLALENTYVGKAVRLERGECQSYTRGEGWQAAGATAMSVPMGAGAVVSSASDITKFYSALFNGKLVQQKSLDQMKTLQDKYGMGLFKFPFYDKWSHGHTGGIDGFSSMAGYFDGDQIAFAVLSNASDFSNNDIAIALLSAVYGKPYEIPSFSIYEVNEEILSLYVGVYSTPNTPMRITVMQKGDKLFAQATGQSAFPITPTAEHVFEFAQAGISITFSPRNNSFKLKQGGGDIEFFRE